MLFWQNKKQRKITMTWNSFLYETLGFGLSKYLNFRGEIFVLIKLYSTSFARLAYKKEYTIM